MMDASELTPGQVDADDLYALLQVSPRADVDVIEAAYRVLARRFHPDVNSSPNATAAMARLNAAWETLRDPAERAAYDRQDSGIRAPLVRRDRSGAVGWAADVVADRQQTTGSPVLLVEPETISAGRVTRGARRSFTVSVQTEPAGIRVTASAPSGAVWLAASPTVLKGLEKEVVTVELRTRSLKPGQHHATIELSTSWERRSVPVTVEVVPASIAFRVAALVRLAATNALFLAALVLIVLLVALVAIAAR
ncbi:MAG: J domain-containing protein [Dehalococcoidia bacterium]